MMQKVVNTISLFIIAFGLGIVRNDLPLTSFNGEITAGEIINALATVLLALVIFHMERSQNNTRERRKILLEEWKNIEQISDEIFQVFERQIEDKKTFSGSDACKIASLFKRVNQMSQTLFSGIKLKKRDYNQSEIKTWKDKKEKLWEYATSEECISDTMIIPNENFQKVEVLYWSLKKEFLKINLFLTES